MKTFITGENLSLEGGHPYKGRKGEVLLIPSRNLDSEMGGTQSLREAPEAAEEKMSGCLRRME